MIVTPTTPFSQRAEPSPLWSGTFPKPRIRHGTTRISRVDCGKADRGCASRVPPSPGVTARRTGGMLVVRATPTLWPLVRHGGGQRWTGVGTPFAPPRGGRSHHSDPWREGVRRLTIRGRRIDHRRRNYPRDTRAGPRRHLRHDRRARQAHASAATGRSARSCAAIGTSTVDRLRALADHGLHYSAPALEGFTESVPGLGTIATS